MQSSPKTNVSCNLRQPQRHGVPSDATASFWRRWFLANSIVAGVLAVAWLVFRSGSKPSRLAYPCQQAAVSAATLALGGPLVATLLAARHHLCAFFRGRGAATLAAAGLAGTCGLWALLGGFDSPRGRAVATPPGYRAEVFHVSQCPQSPIGDHFPGLDNLIGLMGSTGLKFHRSAALSLTSGPEGIIAAGDTVVIKINYQWSERGGTNTDLLRGLIRRLVDHPDGFTGEIVVCENGQFAGTAGFERTESNAEDHGQSPHDVVVDFQQEGHLVSHYDWTALRYTEVDEYADGDMQDGYVVYPFDAQLAGRVSYPKFQTDNGTSISLRDGIWDESAGAYDLEHLKLINVPVLKSHSIYGVTACVKDYMGLVTRELSTNSHSAIANGILGAVLGEIRPADLNILDCIWVNGIPGNGPSTSYGAATRRDELVASVDPVAADIWATRNILVPTFIRNGYTSYGSADPDNPASAFRHYLDNSMAELLDAGYDVTNDPDLIDAISWDGSAACGATADCADLDDDGIRDDACVWWSCEVGLCDGIDVMFADFGGEFGACRPDGTADGHDKFHALNCFSNQDTAGAGVYPCELAAPQAFNVDVAGFEAPCTPDGVCDANDAFAALRAFDGTTPCACPSGPLPAFDDRPTISERASLTLQPSAEWMAPGQRVEVDVYVDNALKDLRGFQLHVGVSGGTRGTLELIDIIVQEPGTFSAVSEPPTASAWSWSAFNIDTSQVLAGLDSAGVSTPPELHLATFVFQATGGARGAFVIELLHDQTDPAQRTVLFPTPAAARIDVTSVAAVVLVEPRRRGRH